MRSRQRAHLAGLQLSTTGTFVRGGIPRRGPRRTWSSVEGRDDVDGFRNVRRPRRSRTRRVAQRATRYAHVVAMTALACALAIAGAMALTRVVALGG